MPFIKIDSKIEGVLLGLWRIEEDEAFFLSQLHLYEQEQKQLDAILHPHKRLEWLSSRLCLKTLLNIQNRVESLRNEEGKPYLSDNSYHISYSHSGSYASVAASRHSQVAIDIEIFNHDRNIGMDLAKMFMNPYELRYYEKNANPYVFYLIWSAKETLFKTNGKRGVYFRDNFCIDFEDFIFKQNGNIVGRITTQEMERWYDIHYDIYSQFILTYSAIRLQEPILAR